MKLRLLSPSLDGTIPASFVLPKDKASFSIGRTKNNRFCVDETAISASHARIKVSDEGGYELIDLGSSNGTFVNEIKIARTKIRSGDIIRFANTRFSFEELEAKEPAPISTTTKPIAISAPDDTSTELDSLKNALWKKDALAADLQKSLDTEKAEKAQLLSDLKTSKNSNESLTKELQDTQSSNNSLKSDLEKLRRDLESEQSRADQLSADLGDSTVSNQSLTQNLADANVNIESLNLTQKELQRALDIEKSKSNGLSSDLGESQDSNQSLTQNLANANANIDSLQLTQEDLSDKHTKLEKAILEALEEAKSIQNNLNSDWRRWAGGADAKTSAEAITKTAKTSNAHNGIAAIAAILSDLKSAREKMRPELDKIEIIWDKCGPEVEEFLTNICSELKEEITHLSDIALLRDEAIAEREADLLALRQGIDEQLRKAQTLNREGIHCEIPEEMEKMVLATDTEETIFREIVARIDTINELSSHYHKKLTSRKIARSLDSLRDDFLDLLKEHSVTPFAYDKGAILTKRDSSEVDLISSGRSRNTPSHMDGPVKVIRTLYPGMILTVGDKEIVIKKAKVDVKPA